MHWSEDELLQYFYGLRSSDQHLDSCTECMERVRQMACVHDGAVRPPEISDEVLASQRRRIYQRLGSPLHGWHPLRWAVAVVAAAIIMIGLTTYRTREQARSRDDRFYAEIAAFDQDPAPRAVQPIEAL